MLGGSKGEVKLDRDITPAKTSRPPDLNYRFRSMMSPTQTQRMTADLAKADDTRELCERLWRFKNLNEMDEEQLRSFLGMLVTWFGSTMEGRYIVKDNEELANMLDDVVSWPGVGKKTSRDFERLAEAFVNTPKEAWDRGSGNNGGGVL